MSIERFGPPAAGGPPYSRAVRAGDLVFVSGQVPFGPDGTVVPGGIEAQTKQAIENIKAILESLGLGLQDVVKATAWLDDTRDFWAFNRVYRAIFRRGAAGALVRPRRHDDRLQGRDRGHRLRAEEVRAA